MFSFLPKRLLTAVVLLAGAALVCLQIFKPARKVDFNTQVKPIINSKCIICHGGVRAKGGFSLLFREEAFAKTASGKPATIAGFPDAVFAKASSRRRRQGNRRSSPAIRIIAR